MLRVRVRFFSVRVWLFSVRVSSGFVGFSFLGLIVHLRPGLARFSYGLEGFRVF